MFQVEAVEKIKTHILCSVTRLLFQIMWKNSIEPDRPHYSMACAHCMLDTLGYRHTHRICNIYCFSTATLVARTWLIVLLSVHCLSCCLYETSDHSLFLSSSWWSSSSSLSLSLSFSRHLPLRLALMAYPCCYVRIWVWQTCFKLERLYTA